jgi:hypothetical protein
MIKIHKKEHQYNKAKSNLFEEIDAIMTKMLSLYNLNDTKRESPHAVLDFLDLLLLQYESEILLNTIYISVCVH